MATIRARIVSGYNNGAWNGTGFKSATAAAEDALPIGYAEAGALFTSFPARFMDEEIEATTVVARLVTRTWTETVKLQNVNRLAGGFGSSNALGTTGTSTTMVR